MRGSMGLNPCYNGNKVERWRYEIHNNGIRFQEGVLILVVMEMM